MAISGVKVKVYIKDAETGQDLGGQRGATLNRSAETLDATSKDGAGWQENVQGLKSWGIDADGLLVESDAAYGILEEAFLNSEKVVAYIELPSGNRYEGDCIITDFPIEAPHDDLVTYSVSLTGTGALAKTLGA